jgi:hypothetical protein
MHTSHLATCVQWYDGVGDLVAFEIEDDTGGGYLAAEGFADRRLYYSPGITEDSAASFRGTTSCSVSFIGFVALVASAVADNLAGFWKCDSSHSPFTRCGAVLS